MSARCWRFERRRRSWPSWDVFSRSLVWVVSMRDCFFVSSERKDRSVEVRREVIAIVGSQFENSEWERKG